PQPYPNHNGGDLVFGPDGLLYIGTGDGGSGGDPEDRAQRPGELLGKMLRIDVDAEGQSGYGIPEGNLDEGRPEVWATGLRNPWRFSFDAKTGDLWIGDVGQNAFEEIDALPASALEPGGPNPNFGWRRTEGFEPFEDSGTTGPGIMTQPVLDYGRDDGCSVTGGQVYRGSAVPDLVGWYVFADFCGKDLRLVEAADVPGSKQTRGSLEWSSQPGLEQVASFGLDPDGELLVVSLGGTIARIEAA
ncbi:MAG: hypothetical protein JWM90_709, partial [Thermoleophilia bacterium]|nr:hypothetical protein [Thermoleophilia bacterium]